MAEDTSAAELNRPKTNGSSPRYFYLVSKQSSQPSTLNPAATSAREGEAKRDEGIQRCHRRGCSSASRESYDNPIPDYPPFATKASRDKGETLPTSEDSQASRPYSVSLSRELSTATTSAQAGSPLAERSSRIPRASDSVGGAVNQLWSPATPSQVLKGFKGNSSLLSETAKPPPWAASHTTMADPGELKPALPINYSSYPVDQRQSIHKRSKRQASLSYGLEKSDDWQEAEGLVPDGDGELDDGISENDSDVVEDRKDKDDDDASYPELDDMGMEEIHRPPPRNPRGGIRWVPWNVPFKRRGQTLVVAVHSLSIVATVSLFFAFCANPFAWPLLLLYLLHVLSSKAATDGSLKYRSEWLRRSYIWHFFADYFPARLHKTHELPATRKYIFGYHPHGIISHGAWAAFATDALGFSEKFPGITNSLLTLDSNFRIPFYREYILGMGVRSVSKESIVNILNKGGANNEGMGRAVTIVVGGARESLEARPGVMRLILKERKGFIKLAVRCGADIVPVLAFGENNLYDQLQSQEHPFLHSIQMFILKVWKFTLPFLHGRGIFNYDVGLMPYRQSLNIVVGPPVRVKQSAIVNNAEINRLHNLYVSELQKLWDRYKDEFAPDRTEELEILF